MNTKTKRSIKWVIDKKNQFKHAGIHLIADFWHGKRIEDPKELKKILIGAVKAANNTPLKISIHKFSPQGITGVVLLAESHISIHSWPEYNYVAIDVFTCGDKSTSNKALDYLKKKFQPKKVKIKKIKRGAI
ncbi:MAG: adenosylmethionine decarboxylase [Candidatus Nealsonbacteria bacterium]